MVILYRRFGTFYWSYLQRWRLRCRSLKSIRGGFVVLPSCCSRNKKPVPYKSAPTIYEGKYVAKPSYLDMKVVYEVQTSVHRHVRWALEAGWALWWRKQYPSGPCVETLLHIPQLMTCWVNPFMLLWNFNMRNKSESTGVWKRHLLYPVYVLCINLALVLWWRWLQLNNFRYRNKDSQSNFYIGLCHLFSSRRFYIVVKIGEIIYLLTIQCVFPKDIEHMP